jgi:hypothetical protein
MLEPIFAHTYESHLTFTYVSAIESFHKRHFNVVSKYTIYAAANLCLLILKRSRVLGWVNQVPQDH